MKPVLAFARLALRDLLGSSQPKVLPPAQLAAAVAWLERAQDQPPDDGVSHGYARRGGWRASSVETSAGVCGTFFDVAKAWSARRLLERGVRIAEWLCKVQNGDGSFPSTRGRGGRGVVLETGQALLALLRTYEETREPRFLKAAREAGDWLVQVADGSRLWTANTHDGDPHVFHTRVAWALLELERVDDGSPYANAGWRRVAKANLDWAVGRQRPSGLFDDCSFARGEAPSTHAIAYALRGLLEAWRLDGNASWLAAARRGAAAVRALLGEDGSLPGRIGVDAAPAAKSTCLTGNCQMAIVWARLHGNVEREGDVAARTAAVRALRYVMATQELATKDLDVRGAIKGSQPVGGRYEPMCLPGGAARFFVDALLLCEEWLS